MSHRTDTRTTKQKALEILEGGQVKSIMNGLWEIKSLTKDSTYEIELVPPSQSVSGYTCGCKAWKFTDDRICKHVVAVMIFKKGYVTKEVVTNIHSLATHLSHTSDEIYELINRQ
tara:strand:- start:2218 stop:2562 length:345 start_codon:yes stop_codon:yes gene_type:complete